MKALISSVEPRETGYRVAQVEQDENIFLVSSELFWIDCNSDVVADVFWYDPITQMIQPIPEPEQLFVPKQPTS